MVAATVTAVAAMDSVVAATDMVAVAMDSAAAMARRCGYGYGGVGYGYGGGGYGYGGGYGHGGYGYGGGGHGYGGGYGYGVYGHGYAGYGHGGGYGCGCSYCSGYGGYGGLGYAQNDGPHEPDDSNFVSSGSSDADAKSDSAKTDADPAPTGVSTGKTSQLVSLQKQPQLRLKSQDVITTLKVFVPEDAKLYLAGEECNKTGSVRTFRTKKLAAGRSWQEYTVQVVVYRNGERISEERTIKLAAGETRSLSFDFDSTEKNRQPLEVSSWQ